MTVAWVIGSGGLLGSAVVRALVNDGTRLFTPAERFRWDQAQVLAEQLGIAVRCFAEQAEASGRWEIYWAAGVGTMGSAPSQLEGETIALSVLLAELRACRTLQARPGAIWLAGSAGAVYAGCGDEVVTEATQPVPTTPYAIEKLRQEELLARFTGTDGHIRALIARISTLYGPGHQMGKKQGLLTYIARAVVRRQPVNIYVPFDTIRDYIHADDAARAAVAALRADPKRPGVEVKIIASERPATVAEIVSTFRRVSRTKPRVVTSISRESGLYSRRIQFRSVTGGDQLRPKCRSLLLGIGELLAHERAAFARVVQS